MKTDHDKVHKSNELDSVLGSLNLTHFRGHWPWYSFWSPSQPPYSPACPYVTSPGWSNTWRLPAPAWSASSVWKQKYNVWKYLPHLQCCTNCGDIIALSMTSFTLQIIEYTKVIFCNIFANVLTSEKIWIYSTWRMSTVLQNLFSHFLLKGEHANFKGNIFFSCKI